MGGIRHRDGSSRGGSKLLVAAALLALVAGAVPATAGTPDVARLHAPVKAVHPAAASTTARVDPRVWSEMETSGATTFWVYLRETADLAEAYSMRDWAERGRFVHDRLHRTAERSQRSLLRELLRRGAHVEPFWIANALLVTGDAETLAMVAQRSEVAEVGPDVVYTIPEPVANDADPSVNAVEWNITRIGAPQVWSAYGATGQGIVVANIDTGALHTHQALVGQYRGTVGPDSYSHDHNWWSYSTSGGCGTPCDPSGSAGGHGTHTMGTMVGDDGGANQIGVAPGARWIAARACTAAGSCTQARLTAAGQWVLAPTTTSGANPQPALRPHVVNNSWGGGSTNDEWFRQIVQSWVAAGIFPVFSAGNSGPGCGTVGNPGNLPEAYAVGAFDSSNAIGPFSGRGPSAFGVVKPDIAAPGVAVRSAVNTSTSAYESWTGTSMAAPHVAGAVALLWSALPAYQRNVAATRTLLGDGAIGTSDTSCGGSASFNNVWGHGRLDVKAAADRAASLPSPPTTTTTSTTSTTSTTTTTTSPSVPPPPPPPLPAPQSGVTVGLVDPAQARWYLRNSQGVVTTFFFGNPGDYPFAGDWNCDGVDTPGLYRQSDGFVYLRNSNTQGVADITFFFGDPGDVPIVGDFNHNGCDTVSIYRPSQGRFFVINALGQNGGGLGAADFDFSFGNLGDKPFVGDFNGNGFDTVGLHRESTGFVYFRNSLTTGVADMQFFFGDPGDRFVAGDWNLNTIDSPAVFRPANAMFYFRFTNTQGVADLQVSFGQPGWLPVAGKFGLG